MPEEIANQDPSHDTLDMLPNARSQDPESVRDTLEENAPPKDPSIRETQDEGNLPLVTAAKLNQAINSCGLIPQNRENTGAAYQALKDPEIATPPHSTPKPPRRNDDPLRSTQYYPGTPLEYQAEPDTFPQEDSQNLKPSPEEIKTYARRIHEEMKLSDPPAKELKEIIEKLLPGLSREQLKYLAMTVINGILGKE